MYLKPFAWIFASLLAFTLTLAGGCKGKKSGIVTENNTANTNEPITDTTKAEQVTGGQAHTCLLLSDGNVKCWGYGYGTTGILVNEIYGKGLFIDAGLYHNCLVITDKTVKCWGNNQFGQIGNGEAVDIAVPASVVGINNALSVQAGDFHTCALLSDGSIKCWGSNSSGELGIGNFTGPESCGYYKSPCSTSPVSVSGINNSVLISAGQSHTCGLLSDGSVKCWGKNYFGQLVDGTSNSSALPVMVSGISNAKGIAAGSHHTCALLNDGKIKCWGRNYEGQLGNGSSSPTPSSPVEVSGINNAIFISAGYAFTCAILFDNSVKCWGTNYLGQLGNSSYTGPETCDPDPRISACSKVPVLVSNINLVSSISLGYGHACAVLSDRTVKCWGLNHWGQLGNGNSTGPQTCGGAACSTTPISIDSSLYAFLPLLVNGLSVLAISRRQLL